MKMVITLFYVFIPTDELVKASQQADATYLAEVSVWNTKLHDRVGQEHTRAQIESSFWTMFLTQLVRDEPEPPSFVQLRAICLRLGFSGCWSVCCTRSGGPAA